METSNIYLYLLKFKDNNHFKIGISNNYERIKTHIRNYGINLEESKLVYAHKDRSIIVLEKHLLNLIDNDEVNSCFSGIDGSTEIRNIKYFNEVIDEIANHNNKLGFHFIGISNDILYPKLEIKKTKRQLRNSINNLNEIENYCNNVIKWISNLDVIGLKIENSLLYIQYKEISNSICLWFNLLGCRIAIDNNDSRTAWRLGLTHAHYSKHNYINEACFNIVIPEELELNEKILLNNINSILLNLNASKI